MIIENIVEAVARLVGDKKKSIVIYSAIWPLLRLINTSSKNVVTDLCSLILSRFSGRTILMPTFTSGFDQFGLCNIDIAPSQTGALSECFRCLPDVRRTHSAYFSFAVHGPSTETLVALRPNEAWGCGSLYEWLYNQDAAIVTLGLHPTHCSYTHYGEWLNRRVITYRHNKTFSGTLINRGVPSPHTETLFVRNLDPEPINDFTHLLTKFIANGMRVGKPNCYPISCIGAKSKIDVVSSALRENPLALITSKEK